MKPTLLTTLAELFSELPGIGPRQARRIAEAVTRKDRAWVELFTRTITDAKKEVRRCPSCMRTVFGGSGSCPLCSDTSRDHSLLLLVEKDVDLEAIERSGAYRGLYFVLGALVTPLDAEPERKARLRELVARTRALTEGKAPDAPLELIFALSATPDGDDTTLLVKEYIERNHPDTPLRISELGRGLSTGSELEYADSTTIKNAIQRRE